MKRRAKGTEGFNGERAICIRFDEATFHEISQEAFRDNRSFAAQVRHYVASGRDNAHPPAGATQPQAEHEFAS